MNTNLTNDQRRLINMYINQYNMTNSHIEHLLNMLDDIRDNIFNIITYNQPRRTRINRNSRNSNPHINTIINELLNDIPNMVRYDYNRPINPNLYNQTRTQQQSVSTNELTDFFTNFLNTNVQVRPTQQQIETASRLIRYSSIENPLSYRCPISLENFSNDEMVIQLKPCGHLFCQSSFQQWFQNNVHCPVCRYDIRDYRVSNTTTTQPNSQHTIPITTRNRDTTSSIPNTVIDDEFSDEENEDTRDEYTEPQQPTNNFTINRNPISNQIDYITFDITNSELPSNVINNITNRLLQSLIVPQSTNNNRIVVDASNNTFTGRP